MHDRSNEKYERARRRAERHAKQEDRVQGNCCQFCGEQNARCVKPIKVMHNVHHIAGEANDPYTIVWVCLNCHSILSDAQQDYSPGLLSHKEPATRKRRRIAMLRGASDCLALLAEKLYEVADELEFDEDEGDENNE